MTAFFVSGRFFSIQPYPEQLVTALLVELFSHFSGSVKIGFLK